MSRTTSSDHLSPTKSSVFAMGQRDRASPPAFVLFAFIRPPLRVVTCNVQVSMLHSALTCKVQVTVRRGGVYVASRLAAPRAAEIYGGPGRGAVRRGATGRMAVARLS